MESREMVKTVYKALEDKKAVDIRIIDISNVSVIADYFIIAGANNERQVQALADNVEDLLGKAGAEPKSVEGYGSANWILMDYRDVIVHIFNQEQRLFYDLERIWTEGKTVTAEDL